MSGEITLNLARFGMGNQNHDHVHRNNILNLNSQAIDTLKMEQFQGGVKGTTLAQIAAQSGSLSANPHGIVSIEDGFNVRRGIGVLKFTVTKNALSEVELAVMVYLTGGGADENGIDPSTMIVPVRAWAVDSRNRQDNLGMPMRSSTVTSSNQFLMGDPYMVKDIRAIRPMDVANESLGMLAVGTDPNGNLNNYTGLMNSNLSKTVQPSKTNNLNPTHHSRELLRIATQVSATHSAFGIENAFSESLGPSINEISTSDNEFFQIMMFRLGQMNMMNGFQGWSVGELMTVFPNLPQVLDLRLLRTTDFGSHNNTLDSNPYGSMSPHEIIASELAFVTTHVLMSVGLTSLHFAATNNPVELNAMENSVGWAHGEFTSVLDGDDYADQRVEDFKNRMEIEFFSRYSTGYIHNSTILSVEVKCSVFGETSVFIHFDDNEAGKQRFVNATYNINRTSSNVTPSQASLDQARNFMDSITDHFAS